MRVWVDASVLTALDSIGEIGLVHEILTQVHITPEVQQEVFNGRESRALREALGDWIEARKVEGALKRWQSLGLNRGEASLFLTPQTDRLVLDEAGARTMAESEGRDYIGLLGLLVAGAQRTDSFGPRKGGRATPGPQRLPDVHGSLRAGSRDPRGPRLRGTTLEEGQAGGGRPPAACRMFRRTSDRVHRLEAPGRNR